MSTKTLKTATTSIVILGKTSVIDINPGFFYTNKLIGTQDFENSQIKLISEQISEFQLPWCTLKGLQKRFDISTTQYAYAERVRDLASQFYSLDKIDEVEAFGLNYDAVYEIAEEEKWHHIGNKLCPKEIVKRYFNDPGLNILEYRTKRDDNFPGEIKIRLYSIQTETIKYGIGLNINDHYLYDKLQFSKSEYSDKIFNQFSQRINQLKSYSDGLIEDSINL